MVVDMKKCWEKGKPGCTDCILACHVTHNVPDIGSTKEEVKWLWTEHFENAFPGQESNFLPENVKEKPFMVLCNHCAQAPCVRVCPTQATFKRADGITMMDYHRCIGCRFCVAGCPYGARSMNFRDPRPFIKEVNPEFPTRTNGVVEKCTFCFHRIDRGIKEGKKIGVDVVPACVESCPTRARVFGDLDDTQVEHILLLPAFHNIIEHRWHDDLTGFVLGLHNPP
jgi:molybdopterin-containing oxidoreductase family iron-sulfur binding subunit